MSELRESTESSEAAGRPARPDGDRTWIRWSGVAFGVLFLVGWIMAALTWDNDATSQEIVDWYDDSGNRIRQIIGTYLTVVAGVVFIVFSSALARRIPNATIAQTVRSMSLVFSTLLIAAVIAIATPSASVVFGNQDAPQAAETIWLIEGIGFGTLLLGGAMAVGLAMGLASYGLRGTGAIPNWLVVAGYVAGGLVAVLGTLMVPMVLLVLWSVAVGLSIRES